MDTLASYDWVEIGHLWFEEVAFSDGYGSPQPQYNFTRFHDDGTMNEYTAGPDSATGMASIRYHAHNHPWQMTVIDTLQQSWLCYDPEDCMRIVSLHDRLLILDIDDGLASLGELDYPRRYRVVYMGVKKAF